MQKIKTGRHFNRTFLITDTDRPSWWRILQLISRFTWELPQQLLGTILAGLFMMAGGISKTKGQFKGATFLESKFYGRGAGLTLGNIITIGPGTSAEMKQHEFGHYMQSRILGPLYLPLIALPSLIWAITLTTGWKYGYFTKVDYESFFIEKNATMLGMKYGAGIE